MIDGKPYSLFKSLRGGLKLELTTDRDFGEIVIALVISVLAISYG
jgi:hypothetical protein